MCWWPKVYPNRKKRNHLHALKTATKPFSFVLGIIYFSSGAVYFYRCLLLSIFGSSTAFFLFPALLLSLSLIHFACLLLLPHSSHLFCLTMLSTFTFYSYQTHVKWLHCNATAVYILYMSVCIYNIVVVMARCCFSFNLFHS